jgi:predicted RNA polymerase sigma factor
MSCMPASYQNLKKSRNFRPILEFATDRWEPAQHHFGSALTLARNEAERHFFSQRLHACEEGSKIG